MTFTVDSTSAGGWGERILDPSNSGTGLGRLPKRLQFRCRVHRSEACNYDPAVITDDGSQRNLMRAAYGGNDASCSDTDETACNYDPSADVDDGSCIINGSVITFVLLTDNYPEETTWNITDASGSIALEGGPYNGLQTTYTSTVCLNPGVIRSLSTTAMAMACNTTASWVTIPSPMKWHRACRNDRRGQLW